MIFLTPRKEKKEPVCEMFESSWSLSSHILPILSWKLKIIAYTGSIKIPSSSKLELLCQYGMTSIVPKSSIIDAWGSEILIWFVCFLCETLSKRLKLNEVAIYMFKVNKKGSRTRREIYPKLLIKTPKQC